MLRRAWILAIAAALLVSSAWAQAPPERWSLQPSSTIQGTNLLNSSTTAAANTAVVVTLTGVRGQRVHLFGVSAYCSAGTATLTITDGGTTIFASPTTFVDTAVTSLAYTPAALTGTTGASIVVTLGACGAGNTGTVNVVADRY